MKDEEDLKLRAYPQIGCDGDIALVFDLGLHEMLVYLDQAKIRELIALLQTHVK